MDFRELRYITAVADCRSVTAAAKKLYISQPSLSQIIAKVEKELGVQLFDRAVYPISLTYAGERYVDTARKILMMNDNLRRELQDIGEGKSGMITLGIPTERAGYMLSPVMRKFQEIYPGVQVRTIESKADELLEALTRGEINFIILPKGRKELPAGLKTEVIYYETLWLVGTKELFAAAGVKTVCAGRGAGENGEGAVDFSTASGDFPCVAVEQLNGAPMILLKKGHAIRRKADALFKSKKMTPDIRMEVSSCISATQLAATGLGIALVPQRALDVLGGPERFCCCRIGAEPEQWAVNAVYLEDAYLDRAERCLIDLMKGEFAGHEQP